jgi:hypothetical protein
LIVVRVELWSAVTGKKTEIARLDISNIGGSLHRGNYKMRVYRGRNKETLDAAMKKQKLTREAVTENYPRLTKHVWNLVTRLLVTAGYK